MPKSTPAHNPAKAHLRDIVLLFSVPIGIIVIALAFLYIPRLFAHPAYDFIYCEGYLCSDSFIVDPSGKIAKSPEARFSFNQLYYYDAARDATRPLHFDEATRYELDPTSKSPDGYLLKNNSGSSGFLFWSNYQDSWSLAKGAASKPITLGSSGSEKKLIGWVL